MESERVYDKWNYTIYIGLDHHRLPILQSDLNLIGAQNLVLILCRCKFS